MSDVVAQGLRNMADYADETTIDNAVEPCDLRHAADYIDYLVERLEHKEGE